MGLHRYDDPKQDGSNRRAAWALSLVLVGIMISMLLASAYAAGDWARVLPAIAAVSAVILVSTAHKFWRRKEASK